MDQAGSRAQSGVGPAQSPAAVRPPLHPVPDADPAAHPRYAKLGGRKVLITGGDSHISRAVAFAYAEEGADVALVYEIDDAGAEETKRRIERLGRTCVVLRRDIRQAAQCRSAVNEAVMRLEGLNVLVNVSAYRESHVHFEDVSEDEIRRTFETNIFGYMFMAQAALEHLHEGDSIINTGSVEGLIGNPELVPYTASTAAIHAFTKSLALQLGGRGIRVNAVVPGPVWAPGFASVQAPVTGVPAGEGDSRDESGGRDGNGLAQANEPGNGRSHGHGNSHGHAHGQQRNGYSHGDGNSRGQGHGNAQGNGRDVLRSVPSPEAAGAQGHKEHDGASSVEGIALGRAAAPEELAPAYVFLASDDASFVTGALYEVTGGAGARIPTI